ncbi:MAG: type II toxin-antitoxin system HicB family antitoxin [Halomonas sp.]|uniref:type II toxin-antitoxin system HicB family antitoxin n=1 Tax=Halomonas sp. TaxID=1486246 RepID=UPI002ACEEAEC|nr:type II toxin-antitoxin system HicB family antitoxin [Halomonas sp.]MDZ7852021.1 type II toxin-antitoxin system HicB family antitoxin [Halomonas sp.]
MQYPIAIEWGDEHTATGILFPDIPGAITAGDTVEQAYEMAVEVAHIQLEERAAAGEAIPMPGDIAEHRQNPDFAGWGWGLVEIDITPYLGKTEKVNVTLPGRVREADRSIRDPTRHQEPLGLPDPSGPA